MSGRPYSVSSVNTYLGCPRQFYLQYIKREKRPEVDVPIPWRIGTAVHSALEVAYTLRSEDTGPVETMAKYESPATEKLAEEWKRLALPYAHGKYDWAVGVLQKTLDHVQVPERSSDVLGVEYKILGQTEDGTNVIGFADLVLRPSKNVVHIRDWKVTSSAKSAEDLVTDFQLNTYAWFLLREHTWATKIVASHYYPPLAREVQFEVRTDCMEDAISRIEAVAEMVESDQKFEPKPGARCETCQFVALCPAWSDRSEAMVAAEGF